MDAADRILKASARAGKIKLGCSSASSLGEVGRLARSRKGEKSVLQKRREKKEREGEREKMLYGKKKKAFLGHAPSLMTCV